MKKVIGILFILLGIAGAVLSGLLLTVPISEAFRYGADTVEWGVVAFVVLFLMTMLVLILCGVIFFRDKKRSKNEKPVHQIMENRADGVVSQSMYQSAAFLCVMEFIIKCPLMDLHSGACCLLH